MTRGVRPLENAVIIAVGSELLTPYKVDTNSLFLTKQLNTLGLVVRRKMVVGDNREELASAVREAASHADLVVTTGGLGATDDDVTRDAVASAFGLGLEEDADVVSYIRSRFQARGFEMPEINRRQALIPEGAAIIRNPRGTAPGLWIERDDVTIVLLPGPPRELRPLFDQVAEERIKGRTNGERMFRRALVIAGRTETHVEELTQPVYSKWMNQVPTVQTTILASLGQIELHLSTRHASEQSAVARLDSATEELANVLGRNLVSRDGTSLENVVGGLLRTRGFRVAIAESCTGGLVTSRLTDVPGASDYVHAGWTVYNNEAKVRLLGVDADTIAQHGAVSEAVAEAMSVQARERANVDYGIGVTGIAGPGGGSEEKPVGTVCLGLAGPDKDVRVRTVRFPGERDRVKFQASQAALDMLRRALLQ